MTQDALSKLLKGIAVVIDDEIDSAQSKIVQLVNDLEAEGVLFVKIKDVNEGITSFSKASFIILDWVLESLKDVGALVGAELMSFNRARVIEFIKKISEQYYIPLLIFSTESVEAIKQQLIDVGITHALDTGRISVFNKTDLISNNVKDQLNLWLKQNQSAQLFKHLDRVISTSEHNFFNEFDLCNPRWPNHVYNNIAADNPADIDGEFQEFLLTSFSSRIQTEPFNGEYINECELSSEDILKIYSSIKFLSYNGAPPIGAYCGDLYSGARNGKDVYLLNITAPCDIRKGKFLLLRGEGKETREFDKKDKVLEHTIFQIYGKDSIVFKFDSYTRRELEDMNVVDDGDGIIYERIGRLLHPYITNLQDRFATYLIRRGFTRTPQY